MNLFGFQLLEFTPVGLLCLVGWIVAGLAIGKLLFKDDRQLIALKREANQLAETLAQWGFTVIPKLLTDFVVTDPVSLVNDFRAASDKFKNPKEVRLALEKLLNNMVTEELKDATTRQAFVDSVVSQAANVGVFPKPAAANGTSNGAASSAAAASPHVTNVTVHAVPGATTTTDAAAPAKAA